MTLRKLDYELYLNARKWLDTIGVIVDPEDLPMLSRETVIDITGRDKPVIIHGTRPGPLAKSQLVMPWASAASKTKKKKVATATIADSSAESKTSGQKIIFAIAPQANPFSKKEDIDKVTWSIPMDGSAEVIIASSIIASQLSDKPFIKNIKHDVLAYNPLNHSSGPREVTVIRDPKEIEAQVLYDTILPDLSSMAKIRISVDPYAFWLDMNPGDVLRYMINAEDTCAQSEYRHAVK
jgi:hypothetical protein